MRCGERRLAGAIELLCQAAVLCNQHHSGGRGQCVARRRRHQVGAPDEHRTLRRARCDRTARLVHAMQCLERSLQVPLVGRAAVVEDHEIDGQLLQAPVLVSLQQLARDGDVVEIVDLEQHDRQIARDPLAPDGRGRAAAAPDRARRRSQRCVGVQHVPGQALEQRRVRRRDAQVAQLDLGLRPRESACPGEGVRIAVLVQQVERLLSRRCRNGPVGHPDRRAGRHAHAAAQREHGIEDRADRVGQPPSALHADRPADFVAAAKESRAIGLELERPCQLALDDGLVGDPDGGLRRRALASRCQQCAVARDEFRLHEQFREGGVGCVRRRRRERQFGARGHVQIVSAVPRIGDRQVADLGVILGRHDDFQPRGVVALAARNFRPVLGERHVVRLGFGPAGLMAGRPDLPAFDVAQEHVAAPVVARRVLAPARDAEIPPAAVAGAGCRHHHRIAPVRKQVCLRRRVAGRVQATNFGEWRIVDPRRRPYFLGARVGHGDISRRALLQQQFRRAHRRLVVKPSAHDSVQQHVGDRDDRHALVVRHEGAHDRAVRSGGHAAAGVVDRLVVAIAAERAGRGQPVEIDHRLRRFDHGRQGRCIRRDDGVRAESPLQAESRHAEVRVLVGEFEVAGVVSGFGDAPGHAEARAVLHLAAHDQSVGLLDEAADGRLHDERRHQVLEHRTRPRDEGCAVADRGHRPAEAEPVARGDVSLGDADEARKPRLGGEQVVATRVQRAVGHAIADRQQPPLRIEQEAELHVVRHRTRRGAEPIEPLPHRLLACFSRGNVAAAGVQRTPQGVRPEVQVAVGLVAAFVQQGARDVHERFGIALGRGPQCNGFDRARGNAFERGLDGVEVRH